MITQDSTIEKQNQLHADFPVSLLPVYRREIEQPPVSQRFDKLARYWYWKAKEQERQQALFTEVSRW